MTGERPRGHAALLRERLDRQAVRVLHGRKQHRRMQQRADRHGAAAARLVRLGRACR